LPPVAAPSAQLPASCASIRRSSLSELGWGPRKRCRAPIVQYAAMPAASSTIDQPASSLGGIENKTVMQATQPTAMQLIGIPQLHRLQGAVSDVVYSPRRRSLLRRLR